MSRSKGRASTHISILVISDKYCMVRAKKLWCEEVIYLTCKDWAVKELYPVSSVWKQIITNAQHVQAQTQERSTPPSDVDPLTQIH